MPRLNDPALIEKLHAVLAEYGIADDRELAADLMQSVMKLAADQPGRAEMKLMARSFKELRYALKIFKPYRNRRKVSVFGSARTPADHPNYRCALEFSRLLAEAGFMVITGAGGGIMAAGHEGAGQAASFGVAIRLPFEQKTNSFIADDDKLIHFRYFFSRKLIFVKETHAIALLPGGFGTHDEGFEVLTLVQTGRCDPLPIVLLEAAGGTYWQAWDRFVKDELLGAELISPEDTNLYFITQDPRAAAEHIARFYHNYHSLRYLDDELVLRVRHAPTAEQLAGLARDFADIVPTGTITLRAAADLRDTELVPTLPRLVFPFDRRSLARLRLLIDRLNTLPGLPPLQLPSAGIADIGATGSDRNLGEIADEESVTFVAPERRPWPPRT